MRRFHLIGLIRPKTLEQEVRAIKSLPQPLVLMWCGGKTHPLGRTLTSD